MTILDSAKSRARGGSVKEAFRNEDGAIDLASIMVGIIVIGIIGGVIAATVFAVIPWAQDNAAKGALDSVATAQSAYLGFTSENGTPAYGTEADLAGGTNAPAQVKSQPVLAASDVIAITVVAANPSATPAVQAGYTAYSKSSSGNFFVSKNGSKAVAATGADLTAAKAASY